jgi:Putative translation initiation inhibitor, yjgF family
MVYKTIICHDVGTEACFSVFPSENGSSEVHAMIGLLDKKTTAKQQFQAVETAVACLQQEVEDLKNCTPVLKRYFVSDAVNQAHLLPEQKNVVVSIVQQPPLNGTKVSLWVYWVENGRVKNCGTNTISLQRGACNHLYTTQMNSRQKNEGSETYYLLDNYTEILAKQHCTLKDNCIRTWIYVQAVDIHYDRMVTMRKTYFEREGLTDKTHYIASTGIEGKYMHPETIVLMDAYSISGIRPEQITYLKGLSHLNPTIEYGVTFERATAIDYGDRRHIYVSGTASIDNKGQVVAPLYIDKQTERTLENIRVLLAEGGVAMNDVAQMIVYLRDTADHDFVEEYLNIHYPDIPRVIVWAPVCRPDWLIEIECIAVKAAENRAFENF